MYLIFYLQVFFVLVSSNPLYDSICCPSTYPSYVNDQPFIVQRSNYNPYPLDLLVHNGWNPITNSQSVPHQYQYLNSNNFIPNYQLYNQNGLDIQHVPETETEKVINLSSSHHYILIPEDYFHNEAIENERHKKTETETRKANNTKSNKRNKSKRRRPNVSPGSADNPEKKTTKSKGCEEETESPKNGRTKSKKKNNKNNLLTTSVVEEILPLKNNNNNGEELVKNTNNHLIGSCGKKMERNKSPTNKPNYQEPKIAKGLKKEVLNDIPDVHIKSKKKDGTGIADVNVCFDINEDCADLVCRHTRNKDVNNVKKPQSLKLTPDLPNNLNNYMNSLTFNQQMNPNIFNPNVNFPFNFDYLYQMPQSSNVQPKETNNRRRSRKRKQPSSNKSTNLNKKNKKLTTVDSCDKIVELTPETPNSETTTIPTETKTNAEELECKNVIQEEPTLEEDQNSNKENPIRTYTETLLTEVLTNDEITNNNNVPLDNYNDVIDEYYPDFTLDNTYMSSKEDYAFSNFHDRYYYAYGDKPELNRERRKYDHTKDNILNCHRKIDTSNKNIIQEPSQIQEIICETDTSKEKVKFLTPSVLKFPGFKTEMIDKEKYFAKEVHRPKNYDINQSTNNICPSSNHSEDEENQHNHNVEMVFANSKVVKYGAPEKEEVIFKVPEPEVKKEFKNLISNDGKTTIVIAKSLGYSK